MIYRFIDAQGTFIVKDPQQYNLYFPLTDSRGSLLSCISPNLSGDIKKNNEQFLTPPASIEDLKHNLLCRRNFFIKINNKILNLSGLRSDKLEAGFLYHKLIKNTSSLSIEILNFIPHNLGLEIMQVKIKNKSKKSVKIIPTSFIPLYGRKEGNLRDHRHVSSLLNRIDLDKYGIYLKPSMIFDETGHRLNKAIYFAYAFEGNKHQPEGQFPTLDYFCGEGDLNYPDAVTKDVKPVKHNLAEFDGKEAAAAFRFRTKNIRPREEVVYSIVLGIAEDRRKIKQDLLRVNSPKKIKELLNETKKYWLNYLSGLNLDFKNNDYNNWLRWVSLQPTLRKLFGCSFLPHFDYGKGGRGWRDLWQDALALLLTEPDKAKTLILDSFRGVRIDGSNATIITKDNNFISDRNKINRVWMDHGVWPYLTLRSYINRSADLSVLLKEVTYFSDHQLKRGREYNLKFAQDDYLLRSKNKKIYKGTILEHVLIQNLVQFFNVGKHNIIRLENADWNDGLDMASLNGESVAFSFMYAHNLKDLCIFLRKIKQRVSSISILKELCLLLDRTNKPLNYSSYSEKQKRLEDYLEKVKQLGGEKVRLDIDDLIVDLEDKYRHLFSWLSSKEWLREGFFNGYYDNKGRRVEGKYAKGNRIILTSQVFAIMSGVASEDQIVKTYLSIKKYLQDKRLKGFRLNTDFGSVYPELGRAYGFSYGDKENGAFFSHMAVMLANALYKRGFKKEGFEVIDSIYTMAISGEAKIYPMIPEYFNAQGKGLYYYLTGSASWYMYTLIEQVLGISFSLGDLILEPKLLPANFTARNIEIKFRFESKKIKVVFIRQGKKSDLQIKKVSFKGKTIQPYFNRYAIPKKEIRDTENIFKVYLG